MSAGMPIFGGSLYIPAPDRISATNRYARTATYNLSTPYAALLAKAVKDLGATPLTSIAAGTVPLAAFNATAVNGWEWYQTTGDITLDDTVNFTFVNDKIVVFVNGNLVVNRNIQCADGIGMPIFIVSGNITFNSTVAVPTTLFEGAYYAGGSGGITFNTNGADTDPTLTVRAVLVAENGSVNSLRDSGVGNTIPAVYYRRTPDLLFLLPSFMKEKKSLWREVAP